MWISTYQDNCPDNHSLPRYSQTLPDSLPTGKFKNLPTGERPQERLEKLGPRSLSDRELLAMLIRSGTTRHDVLEMTDLLIQQAGSLSGLLRWDATDFRKIPGIGKVKALQLSVQTEISRRMMEGVRIADEPLDEPLKVWQHLYAESRTESVEKVWVLCLDYKNKLIRCEVISSGTATGSLVHPREVFRPAIRNGATAVVLAHNHPSGDPTPSAADLKVTHKILDASKLIDIALLDHVILGEPESCPNQNGYYSFSEAGIL